MRHNHSWKIIMQSWNFVSDPPLRPETWWLLFDHNWCVVNKLFLIELMCKISIFVKILRSENNNGLSIANLFYQSLLTHIYHTHGSLCPSTSQQHYLSCLLEYSEGCSLLLLDNTEFWHLDHQSTGVLSLPLPC